MDTGACGRWFIGVKDADDVPLLCGRVVVEVLRWNESRWLKLGSPLCAGDLVTGGEGGSDFASSSSSKLKEMKSELSATLSTFASCSFLALRMVCTISFFGAPSDSGGGSTVYGSGFDHFGAAGASLASTLVRFRGPSSSESSPSLESATSLKCDCPSVMPSNCSGVVSRDPAILLKMARSCAGLGPKPRPRPRGAPEPLPA